MKLLTLPFLLLWMFLQQEDPILRARQDAARSGTSDLDPHLAHTQREALIKADHKKNLEEAEALLKLAEELKSDLEKDDAHIVSVRSMKKTEDIEKLAKNIRGRLKRY
jgi:hypothetical protein